MLATPEFWVAVAFLGFIALLIWKKVPGMVTAALDKRAADICKELDEARRLREEAQMVLADYKRKHIEAESEAQEIIAQARREAEALAEETRKGLKEQLERRTRIAEEKIARAEAQARAEVRAAAVDAALAASEAVIKGRLAGPAGAGLIDQGIKELGRKLN